MKVFNPLAVLVCTVFLLIPNLMAFDPVTPILYFALTLVVYTIVGIRNYMQYLKNVLVLSVFALSLVIINILAPAVKQNTLERSLAIYARSLTLIAVSIGYFYVVNPYDAVRALMQTAGLAPRIGFSLFAGWNTIPLFIRDMKILQTATAFRFGKKKVTMQVKLFGAVILLSQAVRHGERASLSMAVRGIDTIPFKEMHGKKHYQRSNVKIVSWHVRDTILCVSVLCVSALLLFISLQAGWFRFELG